MSGFLLAALLARQFPEVLNGSLTYVPALVILAGLGVYHYGAGRQERLSLLLAAGAFALSPSFRTMDQALCSLVPSGTHFLWHLLNAVVLYLAFRSLNANRRTAIR